MPVLHNKKELHELLKSHNISLTDARARGEFYKNHFDWKAISKNYKLGYDSIGSICKKTGLSYDVVRVNLIRNVGKLRDFSVKGNGNYYFDKDLLFPLSNKGAYLLGWLYSDGCITDNKISITLKGDDFVHLKYLFSLFSDKECYINNKGYAEFNYFDVDLCYKLQDVYNVCKRKSFKNYCIPFKRFDAESLPYLLLGLLDGDGSISKSCVYCQLLLTQNTWKDLLCYLNKEVDLSSININNLNQHGLVSITFTGVSYFSLLEYIYSNTKEVLPLKRKFNNFLTQLNRSAYGRTSPYKKLAVSIRDSLSNNTLEV